MRTYRIDYFAGAWDVVYLKREYKLFESREAAMNYAAAQGYAYYEILIVA